MWKQTLSERRNIFDIEIKSEVDRRPYLLIAPRLSDPIQEPQIRDRQSSDSIVTL